MTGSDEAPASPPESVDRSAIGAAFMRARHLLADGEPKIFRDEFAIRLTGVAEDVVRGPVPPGLPPTTAIWVVRSRYSEDCLGTARKRGIRQFVVLGAGLDSYALRHVANPGGLIVFEVDAPRTQDWKRKRLVELGIALPDNLRLTPCDFESTSIESALADAGFRATEPAFVSWLGVTQYLTRDAIDATLRWAAGLASGSELVLTFCMPSPEMIEQAKRISATLGVNFATFFTPGDMAATLRAAGFARTEHFSPEEAEQTYFIGRTDGMHAPVEEQLMRAWAE